jgi:ABC-type nitrate/sulfonate/bicarbonate transport system substrate-binding protein
MKTGTMDAFSTGDPWPYRIVKDKIGFIPALTAEIWKGHPEEYFAMRSDWVDKYPKATKAILKAIMEAQKASEQRMMAIEQAIPDMNPIMEALQSVQVQVQEQLQAMQPVGIKQIRDESGRLIGGVRVLADGTEQEITIQ